MSENAGASEIYRTIPKEQPVELPYPFLEKLIIDHPQLAHSVNAQIPSWKQSIDTYFENKEIAEILLNNMEYISLEEINTMIHNWQQEVLQALQQNPQKRIFILEGVGGSQKHFAHEVYKSLPQELLDRVVIAGGNEQMKKLRHEVAKDIDKFAATDYYLFDDSVNSAQQITGEVFQDFRYMAEKLEINSIENARAHDFVDLIQGKKGKKPSFNVRTMRVTRDGEKRMTEKWEKQRLQNDVAKGYPPLVELDIKAGGYMPTIDEVFANTTFWDKGSRPASLFRQNQVMGYPTLGFFATKIQDNLPGVFIRNTSTPPEIKPLLNRHDIQTPWQLYTPLPSTVTNN